MNRKQKWRFNEKEKVNLIRQKNSKKKLKKNLRIFFFTLLTVGGFSVTKYI